MFREPHNKTMCFNPDGSKSKQTAGSKLVTSQQNKKKESSTILICCQFRITRNRYCGSAMSEFIKADPRGSLMYSTGSPAVPAGPGRPRQLGHRSLMVRFYRNATKEMTKNDKH